MVVEDRSCIAQQQLSVAEFELITQPAGELAAACRRNLTPL